jgi:predicted amidohydrolase
MKVSVIQPDLKWEDKKANLLKLQGLILPLKNKTDIIVLPEMFTTGFTMSVSEQAEAADGETFSWMSQIAETGNFAVCGSYIVKEAGKYFNRFVFVTPDLTSFHYDKRHLFTMGEEDKWFSKGMKRIVFRYKDFRISPYVCYDLRFPVWSRNKNDYDLAIYCANWPEPRIHVWETLLRARAIENQCYVAGSNRIGTDGLGIHYNGLSQIVNHRGEILCSTVIDQERVLTTDLSLSELNEFRKKFNTLRDADDFELKVQ